MQMENSITYGQILNLVKQLAPRQQKQLLDSLSDLVNQHPDEPEKRSILELQGLGKEIWKNIDTDKYIDQERNSWNG